MKFYVASGFENKELVRYVSQKLSEKGHTHTYDWTKNDRAVSREQLHTIGTAEKQAVLESDFLVVLLPGGKGTHIELGIALGQGKTIYLFSPDGAVHDYPTSTTFYHLDEVQIFSGSIDEFLANIK